MAEFEAAFPYQETPDQLSAIEAVKRDMAQTPADGPPDLRRRRLRQDRGRHPRRVQGGRRRQAGRRARADDDPGRAAPPQLLRADGRVPLHHRGRQPVPAQLRDQGRPEADRRRRRRHPDRHPPDRPEGRHIQGPGPGHHRRGAAVRRRGQGVAQVAPRDGGRPDPLGHADPPDPAHEPAGHPRHLQPGDPAPRPQGDRDPHPPVRRRDDQAGDPPRAEPRRPGLLRPQPRLRHPDRRRPDPGDRPRGADRDRPRPDGGRGAREDDARLHPPRVRHPRGDDDHRDGPRHPQRQHDLHQRGRQVRPGRPAPAPRPGRPLQAPRLRLPAARVGQAGDAQRGQAAQGDRGVHRAGGGLQDRAARPGDPRRGQHPGGRAVGPHRERRLRALLLAAGVGRARR